MDTQLPVWVTVATGVVTALGGAILVLWGKWGYTRIALRAASDKAEADAVKARAEARSADVKVTIEGQRATTDLDIYARNDAIKTARDAAENEKKRADEADARAIRMISTANARAEAAEDRANKRDEECDKRLELQGTRYRDRETAMVKQMQERELQFSEIVDRVRNEMGTKNDALSVRIDSIAAAHISCLEENASIKGRMSAVEEAREEDRRRIEELQTRLDAKDMRRR